MFNEIILGNRLARKRREAGLTQEALIEKVGEGSVSLSTLKRLESGRGHIDLFRAIKICRVLGCSLQDLIGDDTLESALMNYFGWPEEEAKEYTETALMVQQLFYPESMSLEHYEYAPIKTLLQFLIYLPLVDEEDLWDAIRRIEGYPFEREGYVLNLLQWLYREIPDSEAKRYADYQASRCTYQYFLNYYTSDPMDEIALWSDTDWSNKMIAQHDAYVAMCGKKCPKYRP